ncbi:uncharacterized protein V1518DRAFT_420037 [Limtongia smithiae]|uniref:uncharacterized protein n=1 Tax=Limtongia smithiae TaxID=1125753 RepID=UPI0034CE8552
MWPAVWSGSRSTEHFTTSTMRPVRLVALVLRPVPRRNLALVSLSLPKSSIPLSCVPRDRWTTACVHLCRATPASVAAALNDWRFCVGELAASDANAIATTAGSRDIALLTTLLIIVAHHCGVRELWEFWDALLPHHTQTTALSPSDFYLQLAVLRPLVRQLCVRDMTNHAMEFVARVVSHHASAFAAMAVHNLAVEAEYARIVEPALDFALTEVIRMLRVESRRARRDPVLAREAALSRNRLLDFISTISLPSLHCSTAAKFVFRPVTLQLLLRNLRPQEYPRFLLEMVRLGQPLDTAICDTVISSLLRDGEKLKRRAIYHNARLIKEIDMSGRWRTREDKARAQRAGETVNTIKRTPLALSPKSYLRLLKRLIPLVLLKTKPTRNRTKLGVPGEYNRQQRLPRHQRTLSDLSPWYQDNYFSLITQVRRRHGNDLGMSLTTQMMQAAIIVGNTAHALRTFNSFAKDVAAGSGPDPQPYYIAFNAYKRRMYAAIRAKNDTDADVAATSAIKILEQMKTAGVPMTVHIATDFIHMMGLRWSPQLMVMEYLKIFGAYPLDILGVLRHMQLQNYPQTRSTDAADMDSREVLRPTIVTLDIVLRFAISKIASTLALADLELLFKLFTTPNTPEKLALVATDRQLLKGRYRSVIAEIWNIDGSSDNNALVQFKNRVARYCLRRRIELAQKAELKLQTMRQRYHEKSIWNP